jgi:hypothetical protein
MRGDPPSGVALARPRQFLAHGHALGGFELGAYHEVIEARWTSWRAPNPDSTAFGEAPQNGALLFLCELVFSEVVEG